MDELVVWLNAQLDTDERLALDAGGVVYVDWAEGGWVEAEAPKGEWKGPGDDGRHVCSVRRAEDRAYIAAHDPARALREIEAKRATIRMYLGAVEFVESMKEHGVDATHYKVAAESYLNVMRNDAAVYDHRPGFQESWRP